MRFIATRSITSRVDDAIDIVDHLATMPIEGDLLAIAFAIAAA